MKNKTLIIAFIAIISFAMAGCPSGGAGGTTNISAIVYGIAYGGNTFIAMWSSNEVHSADGINWTLASDSKFGNDYINAIAYGNNTFVAVGNGGKIVYQIGVCHPFRSTSEYPRGRF